MPQKYRDRLLKAAITLVKANGGDTNHAIEGDLDFLQAVDEVMEEISEGRSVKINTSETMPPSKDDGPKGVLVERDVDATEPFQPHTGDYDNIDALTGLRWAFESIEEEKKGIEAAQTDAGVPLAPKAGPHLDEISEAVNSGIESLDQFEKTALFAIMKERARQNQKWGGPETDDTRTLEDWSRWIKQRAKVLELVSLVTGDDGSLLPGAELDDDFAIKIDYEPVKVRKLFIEIAALALAALESYDRLRPPCEYCGAPSAIGEEIHQCVDGGVGMRAAHKRDRNPSLVDRHMTP